MDYRTMYPFPSHYIEINGVRQHYLDEGPRDAPVMVMLHGNPTWSFYWRNLITEFSRDHRVIVPDHVGCGLSDKPQEYPYTLETHINNVERLLNSLGVTDITLVMHDWGGAIGMGYATRHPERIRRLAVMNTSAFFRPVLYWAIRLSRSPLLGDLLTRGLNTFLLGALVMGTSQPRRFNRAVRAGYRAPYRNWHDRVAILQFVRDIPMRSDHPTRITIDEIEARLPLLLEKPMIIFWGVDDPVFTTEAFLSGWREHFPQAEVHEFSKAGHFVVEDAHERIIPLLSAFVTQAGDPE